MAVSRRFRRRLVPLAAVCALVLTSCGARLTDAQRAAGIGALGGGGGGSLNNGGGTLAPGSSNNPIPGQSGNTGGNTGGTGTGGNTGGSPAPAPPGGNGGATDVGVTGNKITLATIADVNGVQPGLFRSAWQAMQAWSAMINSQGGIYGRTIDLQLLDSKVDSGATRTAVLQACHSAFALVGSMSAFDDGGAQAVNDCKIPDMTAVTTSLARVQATYTYPIYPNRPDYFVMGSAEYLAKTHPEIRNNAADLYLNTTTTKNNAVAKQKAYGTRGWNWTYKAETGAVESNYTPYVQKMRDKGIKYVTMTSDYQSIARLTQAMKQQSWYPTVMEWDSVVYSQAFLDQVQGAADGSYVYLNTALFSEVSKNPEMQLYEQWLGRVAPGVKPDYFGLYAWSAGRLFQEEITKVGPKLTRTGLLAALKSLHRWDGHGLHAGHDIGSKIPSTCTMDVIIRNNQFQRLEPASGFNCSTPLYHES